MEGRSRNGHPFPWFHRCRNHDQLKFPNPNFKNGLAQRVIINGLFPSENRRVQRIPMSPPPIHVNSNFKSGLAQRFPSTRYFSATLTLTRFYFSQKNVPIPSILMSPELSGITKRNNIPVRLCCREHTLPYRDALPGGDHGDAPVRGTHVSTTQFGL
jgi:hypothetical protein